MGELPVALSSISQGKCVMSLKRGFRADLMELNLKVNLRFL